MCVTELFYQVASPARRVYGNHSRFVHLDSSSFHLHGAYDADEPEREAISITYGYKDILWVTRVPETLAQAKQLVKEKRTEEMVELEPGYLGKEEAREYAGILQRWLSYFHKQPKAGN